MVWGWKRETGPSRRRPGLAFCPGSYSALEPTSRTVCLASALSAPSAMGAHSAHSALSPNEASGVVGSGREGDKGQGCCCRLPVTPRLPKQAPPTCTWRAGPRPASPRRRCCPPAPGWDGGRTVPAGRDPGLPSGPRMNALVLLSGRKAALNKKYLRQIATEHMPKTKGPRKVGKAWPSEEG